MQELITIGIPTYNGAKYLRESLDSVINQTYQNLDILVIDDNSRDDTVSIIEEYQNRDSRIRLIRNLENPGMVANWNRCLKEAKADWIKLHFQDDLMVQETIERMYSASQRLGVRLVLTDREYLFEDEIVDFSQNLNRLSNGVNDTRVIPTQYFFQKTIDTKLNQNFIGEPILGLIHKSLVAEIGYYDVRLHQIVDLEYWLRIGLNESIGFIPDRLHIFRVHGNSQGARNSRAKIVNRTTADKVQIAMKMLCDPAYSCIHSLDHTSELLGILKMIIKTAVVENGMRTLKKEIRLISEIQIEYSWREKIKLNWCDFRNSCKRLFYAFKS